MSMRRIAIALPLVAALASAPARADTFSGFSGVDRHYLVNQDRACLPVSVVDGAAAGAPNCTKVTGDIVARLSIKPPIVQSGAKASFVAQAAGRTITVSKKTGGAIVAWSAPDPVVRIVDAYASQYEDRVAVAYVVRRAGKEVTDVVAFDLGQGQAAIRSGAPAPTSPSGQGSADAGQGSGAGAGSGPAPRSVTAKIIAPGAGSGSGDPLGAPANPTTAPGNAGAPGAAGAAPSAAPPADPRLTKAIADARAAPKAKALSAWGAVLAVDAAHAEALFRTAIAQLAAKRAPQAIIALESLAGSPNPDAVEWQVEARFDPAFAALRADPKFRAAVGLDRKPATVYERLMGFGGQWEQTGTSCDKPEIRFVATRDRKFKLRVKTSCEGQVFNTPFQGNWRIDGQRVVLLLPNQGRAASASDEAGCGFETSGDEDALRCSLGHDLEFVVLPTRR
jgi:hypothetical protein